MSAAEILSQKEKGLVAVAASIASGCLPCTTHHLKAARETGATEAEIGEVMEIALSARNNVTQIIAEAAHGNPSPRYPLEDHSGPLRQPMRELVSLAAAMACNSTKGLEVNLTRAQAAGVTTRLIRTAALIAQAVREEASDQAEAVFDRMVEPTSVNAGEQAGACCQQADHSQCK